MVDKSNGNPPNPPEDANAGQWLKPPKKPTGAEAGAATASREGPDTENKSTANDKHNEPNTSSGHEPGNKKRLLKSIGRLKQVRLQQMIPY